MKQDWIYLLIFILTFIGVIVTVANNLNKRIDASNERVYEINNKVISLETIHRDQFKHKETV